MLATNEQILFTLNWFKQRQRTGLQEKTQEEASQAISAFYLFETLEFKYRK